MLESLTLNPSTTRRPQNLPDLASFPNELLVEIFSYLAPIPKNLTKESQDVDLTLRSLTLVCHRFRAIVEPLLHAHYINHPYYLHLFSSKPHLWERVKSIIIEEDTWNYRQERFRQYLDIKDVARDLELDDSWNPVDEDFDLEHSYEEEGPETGFEESNIERAFVLCLTPNVEEIVFRSWHEDYKRRRGEENDDEYALIPILRAALDYPYGIVHKFEHLHSLSIDYQNLWLGRISCVFALPSLRRLVLERRDWSTWGNGGPAVDDAHQNWACPKGTSNVQDLQLLNSQLPASIVRRPIESCRALTSFTHQNDLGEPRAFYEEILGVLADHRESLKELLLGDPTREYNGSSESIASKVIQFSNLRHLQIPFRLLTNFGGEKNRADTHSLPDLATLLPSSLTSLHLDFWGPSPCDKTTKAIKDIWRESDGVELHSNLRKLWLGDHIAPVDHSPPPYIPPVDYVSLDADFKNTNIKFGYALEWCDVYNIIKVERTRIHLLALPGGDQLVKHSSCAGEAQENAILTRDVGAPFPEEWMQEYVDRKFKRKGRKLSLR